MATLHAVGSYCRGAGIYRLFRYAVSISHIRQDPFARPIESTNRMDVTSRLLDDGTLRIRHPDCGSPFTDYGLDLGTYSH